MHLYQRCCQLFGHEHAMSIRLSTNRGLVQIALTTLEEVFLNIAKAAEIEAAGADAKMLTEVEDGVSLQVPIGADVVTNPDTNVTYKVHWAQDEAGALTVSHAERLAPAQHAAAVEAAPVNGATQ